MTGPSALSFSSAPSLSNVNFIEAVSKGGSQTSDHKSEAKVPHNDAREERDPIMGDAAAVGEARLLELCASYPSVKLPRIDIASNWTENAVVAYLQESQARDAFLSSLLSSSSDEEEDLQISTRMRTLDEEEEEDGAHDDAVTPAAAAATSTTPPPLAASGLSGLMQQIEVRPHAHAHAHAHPFRPHAHRTTHAHSS